MEIMEAIQTRRSVRAYTDKPVSRDLINQVIAAAQMAPSWKNTQTAGFIVVESPEKKAELLEALPSYNARIVSSAPVTIVMTARKERAGYNRDGSFTTKKGDRWEMFDGGIACGTLCLAAWGLGLSTCIMGIYDEEKLPEVLAVPEDRYVTAVVALGYGAETPACPKRKSLEEQTRYV